MTDAGFFKGTSADQDSRFSDKNKKLMKSMKFADNIDRKVDMKKVQLEVLKPFITQKLNDLIPLEDDIIIEYVFSQLEQSNVSFMLIYFRIFNCFFDCSKRVLMEN
jgi:serine/arginine repetitive matrix protein 1